MTLYQKMKEMQERIDESESESESDESDNEYETADAQDKHPRISRSTIDSLMTTLGDGLSAILVIVRCAAHTLQLAVHDVLKNYNEEIKRIRNVVKKLRSSKYRHMSPGLKSLKLNVVTRWKLHSSFKYSKKYENQ